MRQGKPEVPERIGRSFAKGALLESRGVLYLPLAEVSRYVFPLTSSVDWSTDLTSSLGVGNFVSRISLTVIAEQTMRDLEWPHWASSRAGERIAAQGSI